jgi:hypothetical protein
MLPAPTASSRRLAYTVGISAGSRSGPGAGYGCVSNSAPAASSLISAPAPAGFSRGGSPAWCVPTLGAPHGSGNPPGGTAPPNPADPLPSVPAGALERRRSECAPAVGSTASARLPGRHRSCASGPGCLARGTPSRTAALPRPVPDGRCEAPCPGAASGDLVAAGTRREAQFRPAAVPGPAAGVTAAPRTSQRAGGRVFPAGARARRDATGSMAGYRGGERPTGARALREAPARRSGSGQERPLPSLEQRADGGPGQPAQAGQAIEVRARWLRVTPRSGAAAANDGFGITGSPSH